MTLGRCPLSIFCSRGTPSLSQPTLSLPLYNKKEMVDGVHDAASSRQNNSTKQSFFVYSCITQLKAQGPSLTFNESKEEEEEEEEDLAGAAVARTCGRYCGWNPF